MFKALLVSINLIVLVALKFVFGGDVEVNQSFPSEVKEGESFVMEVRIEKGDREGFAKWQQTLPFGFIASAKETAGATFSFKNQDVKLIWMALPQEESIVISYEIEVDPSLIGEFDLEGKFSFIDENERRDVSSGIQKILIGATAEEMAALETEEEGDSAEESRSAETENEDMLAEAQPNEETAVEDNQETIESEPAPEKKETEEVSPAEGQADLVADDKGIKVYRNIKHIENGVYTVNLKIEKGSISSFGKIEEYMPEDFKADIIDFDGGIVSFKNRVLKILWMTLPEKETIKLSYTLTSQTDLFDSTEVHGVFSFLKDNESAQLEVEASHFKNFYVEPVEEIIPAEEAELAETVGEEPTEVLAGITQIEEPTVEQIAAPVEEKIEEPEVAALTPTKEEEASSLEASISNIPAPESSISYKIQIAAGKKEVKAQHFQAVFQIEESISIEYHETWYKYTVGNHNVYKSARDQRNELMNKSKGVKGAFVTAYNAGERISVQEALMISKQKWFK